MVRLRKFYLTDIVCAFIFTFAIKFEKNEPNKFFVKIIHRKRNSASL